MNNQKSEMDFSIVPLHSDSEIAKILGDTTQSADDKNKGGWYLSEKSNAGWYMNENRANAGWYIQENA